MMKRAISERRGAPAHICHGEERRCDNDNQKRRIDEPEDGVTVQEDVADGATTDRGHRPEHDDPDEVEPPTPRGERTADGEHRYADQIQQVEEHAVSAAGPLRLDLDRRTDGHDAPQLLDFLVGEGDAPVRPVVQPM